MSRSDDNDLRGLPVFFLRVDVDCDRQLDEDVDRFCRHRALEAKAFKGVCNLDATPCDFSVNDDNFRDGIYCGTCKSVNRQRALLAILSVALVGAVVSLRYLAEVVLSGEAKILLAEGNGPIHEALYRTLSSERLIASQYLGHSLESGQIVNGLRHENLEATSFPDSYFSVVLTADVMEHVADAPAAEREIVRILKPGGIYVFSIPYYGSLDEDRVRAILKADGSIEYLEQPQYHGDPFDPKGILVFRDFSFESMKARFAAIGCSIEMWQIWSSALGILGNDGFYFVVRKALDQ